SANVGSRAPWHVWAVGIVALLWNCIGAFDYTMTESRNAAYLAPFNAEQLAYFTGLPTWVVATWALGVWGGVLGSLLLLLRQRRAVPVFAVSVAGMAVTFLHNYALSDGIRIMGGGAAVFSAVIFTMGLVLLAYARHGARTGVLR
ncbi:MAG: hypothetical protein RJB26_1044, partial [Pseudomonadota bacterium]